MFAHIYIYYILTINIVSFALRCHYSNLVLLLLLLLLLNELMYISNVYKCIGIVVVVIVQLLLLTIGTKRSKRFQRSICHRRRIFALFFCFSC